MNAIDEANELFLKKKFEQAIEKYEIILQNEPHNLVALNNKGYSLTKLRKYSEAITCYDKSLQKKPEDRVVLINKISTFRKNGELDKALEICNILLKNNSNERIVLYHKLRILKKLYSFSESNIICRKVLEEYPTNGEVLYDMASNFLNIGDIEKFFITLEKAVYVIPNLKNKSRNNIEFKQFHNDKRFLKIVSSEEAY